MVSGAEGPTVRRERKRKTEKERQLECRGGVGDVWVDLCVCECILVHIEMKIVCN